MGWPYAAVGMHSALESAIGLPRRSTKALRMLTFLTPADVRRSLKIPPGSNQMERFHQCGPGITRKRRDRTRRRALSRRPSCRRRNCRGAR